MYNDILGEEKRNIKLLLLIKVDKNLTGKYHAGKILKEICSELKWAGGGRPYLAQAGGEGSIEDIEKVIKRYSKKYSEVDINIIK